MPSIVQEPFMNRAGFVLKEKFGPPLVTGFTAVNGRTSPPSPRKTNIMNGMNGDTIHVRPLRAPSEDSQERKVPLPLRDDRHSSVRLPENGQSNGHRLVASPSPVSTGSPDSTGKRKRSTSAENDPSVRSQDAASEHSRRRLDSYTSIEREEPQYPISRSGTVPQSQTNGMENPIQRGFQPVERSDQERGWPARDHQETMHNGYPESQHRDHRSSEASQSTMNTSPTSGSMPVGGGMDGQGSVERSSTTEITRAGVHVDPKKRKRQFANRTKTGCGTCRRRKKKCDEGKPECNNCARGGFICEGYAHKIPWPKNSISKTHVPLQAKDRFQVEPPQLYHSHGHNRESYQEPNGQPVEGVRMRPIVVDEPERQPPRNAWGNGWGEPPRASYPPDHTPVAEYPQTPGVATHPRPPSNDHHMEHPSQAPAPQRQPGARIYHHTPQTMGQTMETSPAATARMALQHQSQTAHQQPHPMHRPPPTATSVPPPVHHAPPAPVPQKSEKEKMLGGEHYILFAPQLVDEREQCKAALHRFNSCSTNPALAISREERARHFRTILEAPWTRHTRSPTQTVGHLGNEVCVEAPFTCEYGYNISVGDGVVIGHNCTILDARRVTIGANTIIGPNVNIYANDVSSDPRQRNGSRGTGIAKEVHIGENVLVGGNSTILPGVIIGKGATVGAGSVVTRDVPPYVIVCGIPAKQKKVLWGAEQHGQHA